MTAAVALDAGVNDAELFARVRLGDQEAFTALVARHQKRLFLLAVHLLGDQEDAATVTQDCFLRCFQKARACQDRDPERWMTRIAVNLCLDRLRQKRRSWWLRRLVALESEPPAPQPDAQRALLATEAGVLVRRALARLSPRQAAIFVLRHYEERPLAEIAALMSLGLGTVKAHLTRARVRLRRELRGIYER